MGVPSGYGRDGTMIGRLEAARSLEEERRSGNRRDGTAMDKDVREIIQELGTHLGLRSLELDEPGECGFLVDDRVIRLRWDQEREWLSCTALVGEVPADSAECYERLLEANYFFAGTGGFRLGLLPDSNRVQLVGKLPATQLSAEDLYEVLENLVNVADYWEAQMAQWSSADSLSGIPPSGPSLRV